MPDETGQETPPTETPGQEVVVEPIVESPVLPETSADAPPAETSPMTPEEKREHDMKSWIGRRDAELRAEIQQGQQTTIEAIRGMMPPPASPPPAEAPDPAMDADAWFEHKLQKKQSDVAQFNETLIRTGAAMLQQDELIKTDPGLANEIYQEVQSGRVQIDRNLPAETAAAVVVATAKSNILSRRVLNKPNPLAGNAAGVTGPVGGVTPPPVPKTVPAQKMPEMSDYAKAYAKRTGMTEAEVIKALGR